MNCISIGGYFGVTAMTGQLVDEHQMVKFDLYHNIETQPFEYAHDNVVHEMPEMWRDMRESGKFIYELKYIYAMNIIINGGMRLCLCIWVYVYVYVYIYMYYVFVSGCCIVAYQLINIYIYF